MLKKLLMSFVMAGVLAFGIPTVNAGAQTTAEQDAKKAEPGKYAKMGHDNLVRFLKQGGLM